MMCTVLGYSGFTKGQTPGTCTPGKLAWPPKQKFFSLRRLVQKSFACQWKAVTLLPQLFNTNMCMGIFYIAKKGLTNVREV